MQRFARAAAAVAKVRSTREKVAILAQYLQTLDDADLEAATRFFTGNPFAARDSRSLNVGSRAIVTAAQRIWNFTRAALSERYREEGDLGAALGPLARSANELRLFTDRALSPSTLYALFERVAAASGKGAGKQRETLVEEILRSCTDSLEATYVIKIFTGDLRIGLREGLVHDALAVAFETTHREVARAAMASGDLGAVAVAAKHRKLDAIRLNYESPFGFMLASPMAFGDDYPDLADHDWFVEDKYDGIRAQAHVSNGHVSIFSRTLNDVSRSYPEICEALADQSHRMIVDGEIVALRDGRVLPFRTLQARLSRKELDAGLLAEIPLSYVIFDAIAIDDRLVIDETLERRRHLLEEIFEPAARAQLAPVEHLPRGPAARDVNARFERARARGNEGIMLKRVDAPYRPGRRGKYWLKLKRELSTLDVVVVGVEWGHGKRAKMLSDYTFAVRDENGDLRTIGKAYSGLTDAEITDLTSWFLAHTLAPDDRARTFAHAIAVEPRIVLEVAFDIVAPSELHQSGFALRFPRIVRIRDDKPASEIDDIQRVKEIYGEMLRRERVPGAESPERRLDRD